MAKEPFFDVPGKHDKLLHVTFRVSPVYIKIPTGTQVHITCINGMCVCTKYNASNMLSLPKTPIYMQNIQRIVVWVDDEFQTSVNTWWLCGATAVHDCVLRSSVFLSGRERTSRTARRARGKRWTWRGCRWLAREYEDLSIGLSLVFII